MGVLDWLQALFGPMPAPPTRLSADQAIQLAIAATGSEHAFMASVRERDGALIWSASEVVRGRSLHVEIDDATGEVLQVVAHGLR